jgi:hypothetical protein
MDAEGKPHCVQCIVAASMPPAFSVSSDVDPAYDDEPATDPPQHTSQRRQQTPLAAVVVAGALMLALVIGALWSFM